MKVVIPGSRTSFRKHSNLIFVKQSSSSAILTSGVDEGSELSVYDDISLSATPLSIYYESVKWYSKVESDNSWSEVAQGLDVTIKVPYVDEKEKLLIKVEVISRDIKTEKILEFIAKNPSRVEPITPAPFSQIKSESEVTLDYKVFDVYDNEVERSEVSWFYQTRHNGYVALSIDIDGKFRAPKKRGVLWLKAKWSADGEHDKSYEFPLYVVKRYKKEVIDFNPLGNYSGFEPPHHGFGRLNYEINCEKEDPIKSVMVMNNGGNSFWKFWGSWVDVESYVELSEGENIRIQSGNGRYKVKLYVGPNENDGKYRIGDKNFSVDSALGDFAIVTTEVEIADGWLQIEGENSSGVRKIEILRLEDNDSEVEDSIDVEENLSRLSYDDGYCGFNPAWWEE